MIILGKGTVITRDTDRPIIYDGAVAIDGTQIIDIGTYDELCKTYTNAELIDAHNGLIMPGFINAHHHIYSALARGLSLPGPAPTNFGEILEGLWFYLDNKLTAPDVKASALLTYLGCIENGVTTIFDHHASYGETANSLSVIADVAKQFGVRSCLCYEVSDRNGVDQMKAAVAENVRFGKEAKKDPSRLAAMMGLHASFTLSSDTLDYVKAQNEDKLGYHVHVAEGPEDVADSKEKYGMTPVRRLVEAGILGPKSIAGHCVHVTDQDVELLKESQAKVVHNPESNMGNAVGAPNVLKLMEAGIPVGLGTDGYTSDMLESYKVANCLVKHNMQHPNVGWTEIPNMLFNTNPAMIEKFFPVKVGTLTPGAEADVIVLDYIPRTDLHADNINGHLLFGLNGLNVITTISGGKVRMLDRQLCGINKEELLREVRQISHRLWKRLVP